MLRAPEVELEVFAVRLGSARVEQREAGAAARSRRLCRVRLRLRARLRGGERLPALVREGSCEPSEAEAGSQVGEQRSSSHVTRRGERRQGRSGGCMYIRLAFTGAQERDEAVGGAQER